MALFVTPFMQIDNAAAQMHKLISQLEVRDIHLPSSEYKQPTLLSSADTIVERRFEIQQKLEHYWIDKSDWGLSLAENSNNQLFENVPEIPPAAVINRPFAQADIASRQRIENQGIPIVAAPSVEIFPIPPGRAETSSWRVPVVYKSAHWF